MLWAATIAMGEGGNDKFGGRFIGSRLPSLLEGLVGLECGGVSGFGLEAKNSLFLKEELGLLTCVSTPVKLLKPAVVFMPATPAEGFLMVPGVAPLKYLAPVKGP